MTYFNCWLLFALVLLTTLKTIWLDEPQFEVVHSLASGAHQVRCEALERTFLYKLQAAVTQIDLLGLFISY